MSIDGVSCVVGAEVQDHVFRHGQDLLAGRGRRTRRRDDPTPKVATPSYHYMYTLYY